MSSNLIVLLILKSLPFIIIIFGCLLAIRDLNKSEERLNILIKELESNSIK